MAVVLFEAGGVARSGHLYGDRSGIEYEYPSGRYERWICPGERFVYTAPRVGYIGCGVIGEIRPSFQPNRLVCDVLSVEYFRNPVSLKAADGRYYEADPEYWRDSVYFGQGVRPLSNRNFDAIVAAAGQNIRADRSASNPGYADSATTRRVEAISIQVAIEAMNSRFNITPIEMPHNNPGFDLRVGEEPDVTRYVEVKGTQGTSSTFFMSEGERQFSMRNSERYTLVVVSGINIELNTHSTISTRDGAVMGDDVSMEPSQWRGRIMGDGDARSA